MARHTSVTSPPRTNTSRAKWVVIGHNPDGSPYVVMCETEAQATKLAKELKGRIKQVRGKGK